MGTDNLDHSKDFSKENQPKKRGRPKNVFGPLAKENNLSLDDIRKIYKNILTTDSNKLNTIAEKFPTSFTKATIDVFKQEMFGTLTGKQFVIKDKNGDKIVQERVKSYHMVEYMLERIFGKTVQSMDINTSGSMDISSMSIEERQGRIEELLKKMAEQNGSVKTD
jgi:transcriptional regulator of heat shock response